MFLGEDEIFALGAVPGIVFVEDLWLTEQFEAVCDLDASLAARAFLALVGLAFHRIEYLFGVLDPEQFYFCFALDLDVFEEWLIIEGHWTPVTPFLVAVLARVVMRRGREEELEWLFLCFHVDHFVLVVGHLVVLFVVGV